MKITTVHDRKKRARKYFGEAEAAPLLSWLNAANASAKMRLARANVESIMERIQALYTLANKSPRQEKSIVREQGNLNKELLQFEFVHLLDYRKAEGVVTWTQRTSADLTERDYVPGEAESVARVIDLAKVGVLAQIRKCECGLYFFARFPKREPPQRFHSAECRVKFWDASSQRKEQKQKNARKYYELHKNHNVK
jgi:hypothetical protein